MENRCFVGRDDDGGQALVGLMALVMIIIVVCIIVMAVVGLGFFIGGWHSLKNYVISFNENIIEVNKCY